MSTNKAAEIIDAAKELFTVYGFAKTTMTDIAGRLNMSKASLYYYFKDKETIFHALRERELEQLTEEITKIRSNTTNSSSKLLDYTKKKLKFLQKSVTVSTPVTNSIGEMNTLSGSLLKEFKLTELNFVKGILQKGIEVREFNAVNIDEYAGLYLVVQEGLRTLYLSKQGICGNRINTSITYEQLTKQSVLFTEMFLHSISS